VGPRRRRLEAARRRGLAAALALAALAAATPAAAHERHGVARGYLSTVSAIQPNVLGLSAFVIGGDDRLLLRNLSPQVIVIRGYEGEPYLRFTPRGVFENVRSPASYLNRVRFPVKPPPPIADPAAPPRWRRVSTTPTYQWHDHRIQWMRGEPPPAVAAAPGRPHKIFDWRVPATANGKPFAINGFLGYAPSAAPAQPTAQDGGGGEPSWTIPVAVALGVLAIAALVFDVRRRRKHA
jgi:hypothetical protein